MSALPPEGTEEESHERGLPPGVKRLPDGRLVREKEYRTEDGSVRVQLRPVVLSLEEAREIRADYYHPELGWILEGYKLERDRTVESIMADTSVSVPKRPK